MDSSNVVAGTNATATQYNNLRKDLVLGNRIVGTDTDASTVTFDMGDITKGSVRTVVLGGNRTLALSNVSVNQIFIIRLVQDTTGTRTVTWFSTIKWNNGITPTLTTTANKTDVFGFICTSAGNYDGYIVGVNL